MPDARSANTSHCPGGSLRQVRLDQPQRLQLLVNRLEYVTEDGAVDLRQVFQKASTSIAKRSMVVRDQCQRLRRGEVVKQMKEDVNAR